MTCIDTLPQKLNEFLKKQTLTKWSLGFISGDCCNHGFDNHRIHCSDILPIISNFLICAGYQKVYDRWSFSTNNWSDEYTCENPSKVRKNLEIIDPIQLLTLIKQNQENYCYAHTNRDPNNTNKHDLSHAVIDLMINHHLNEYVKSFGITRKDLPVAYMKKEDWDNIGSYLQAKYNRCSLKHCYYTLEMSILD